MKGKFKRFASWCDACDKDWVPTGKRCNYCKNKRFGLKIKKPTYGQIRSNFDSYC